MGDDRSSLMAVGQRPNSSEHKHQNYATSWVDSSLFSAVVQQDRRKAPPSMEGQGALKAMMGACPIPYGRDG